ncbi:MAG: hypothetical protein ACLPUT_16310 [Solirubrobacteraceae bacterium]|jgi:hypothetical protein
MVDLPADLAEADLACFVIGPIGSRHAPIGTVERDTYEQALLVLGEVIEPACQAVGLNPVRSDGLTQAGEINEQVFRRLRDDDVVIADLTGANANVMYELGLRHTRGKLTVQIGEYGRLPFDINTIRTIQFSSSAHGLIQARDDLIAVLEAGLAGAYDPVTATRVWEDMAANGDEAGDESGGGVDGEVGAEAALGGERGFVDILAEAEQQQSVLLKALDDLSACSDDLTRLAEQSTEEIARSDAAGKGMRGRLQVVTRHAQGLATIGERLTGAVDRYEASLADVSAGTMLLIERMRDDPTERAEGWQFGLLVRRMAKAARGGMESTSGLASSIAANASSSRVLKEPSGRIVGALERMVRSTAVIDEWDRQMQALGVPVPPDDWEPDLPAQAAPDSEK